MSPEQLKAKFPHASQSFLRRNASKVVDEHSSGGVPLNTPTARPPITTDEDKLNKTEKRWLEVLRSRGFVYVGIQPLTLKLGHDTRYTPDFVTFNSVGLVCCWEVKGAFVFEKALYKPRMAAHLWPVFCFMLAQWKEGQWTESLIKP